MKTKHPVRKELDKLKKRKNFYNDNFGGKDKRKQIHHIKMISRGGKNNKNNLVYLFSWLHVLYHKLLSRGEIDQVKFRGMNPGLEKQCDDLADGCIAKVKQKHFKEDLIKDLKSRER